MNNNKVLGKGLMSFNCYINNLSKIRACLEYFENKGGGYCLCTLRPKKSLMLSKQLDIMLTHVLWSILTQWFLKNLKFCFIIDWSQIFIEWHRIGVCNSQYSFNAIYINSKCIVNATFNLICVKTTFFTHLRQRFLPKNLDKHK